MSSVNPFAPAERLTLRTRLAPEECFRRLREATLPWSQAVLILPALTSPLPLMGWVSREGFAVRKLIRYGNGLQTEAAAAFVAAHDGTRMALRLGPRRWVVVGLGIWLALVIVAFAGVALLCYLLPGPRCGGPPVTALVIPVLFLAILVFARWLARGEDEFLLAFLKQKLEAEEVPEARFDALG